MPKQRLAPPKRCSGDVPLGGGVVRHCVGPCEEPAEQPHRAVRSSATACSGPCPSPRSSLTPSTYPANLSRRNRRRPQRSRRSAARAKTSQHLQPGSIPATSIPTPLITSALRPTEWVTSTSGERHDNRDCRPERPGRHPARLPRPTWLWSRFSMRRPNGRPQATRRGRRRRMPQRVRRRPRGPPGAALLAGRGCAGRPPMCGLASS